MMPRRMVFPLRDSLRFKDYRFFSSSTTSVNNTTRNKRLPTLHTIDYVLGDVVRHEWEDPVNRTKVLVDPVSPLKPTRLDIIQRVKDELGSGVSVVCAHHPVYPPMKRREDLKGLVRHVVAVSSGKGGVGKSTVAVNLACIFQSMGARTGLFDADVQGPSLPTMMVNRDEGSWAVTKRPDGTLDPVTLYGVKCMSYGFVAPGTQGKGFRGMREDGRRERFSAALMRGPMTSKTTEDLVMKTNWGELDVLVIDLPPGTGDVHLTILQKLSVDACVVVTTPQEVSFPDVARGFDMLETLKAPVVALVENYAGFECGNCKTLHFPFGRKGGEAVQRLAEAYGLDCTVSLPMLARQSEAGDEGRPLILSLMKEEREGLEDPALAVLRAYEKLLFHVTKEMVRSAEMGEARRPHISYDANRNVVLGRFVEASRGYQLEIPPLEIRRRLREVDAMMGLKSEALDSQVRPLEIVPKGNYAVGIKWSDGFDKSMYTYEALRRAMEEFAAGREEKK